MATETWKKSSLISSDDSLAFRGSSQLFVSGNHADYIRPAAEGIFLWDPVERRILTLVYDVNDNEPPYPYFTQYDVDTDAWSQSEIPSDFAMPTVRFFLFLPCDMAYGFLFYICTKQTSPNWYYAGVLFNDPLLHRDENEESRYIVLYGTEITGISFAPLVSVYNFSSNTWTTSVGGASSLYGDYWTGIEAGRSRKLFPAIHDGIKYVAELVETDASDGRKVCRPPPFSYFHDLICARWRRL